MRTCTKLILAAILVLASLLPSPPRAITQARAVAAVTPITPNGSWPVYHHDNAHTGSDPTLPSVTSVTVGWTSATLDAEVYAEPLISGGIVYVGTLNNSVYALNQTDGSQVWHVNLSTPKASGWVCGNVAPQGILGTPVLDVAANRIYVATLSSDNIYRVIGLNLLTGATVLTTAIPASIGTGFDWKIQQQRGALALANGYVYVPFGGRAGDCFDGSTPYYGWVVGVPIDGVSALSVFQTPSGAESVWAAGGVVVDDSSHNVFFATGNAIPCSGAVMSDSIVRVSPTLTAPTYFQPNDWQANWCGPDSDLGSASPVLISPTLMFSAGKHGGGFLVDPTNLGGLDGQLFPTPKPAAYSQADVCFGNHADATFGSFAYAAPFVYVECDGRGLVALRTDTATPSFGICDATCGAPDWHAGGATTYGPPIVAGGAVWVAGNSGLTAYDAATGGLVYQSPSFGVNRFVTPAEASGQVFVPSHTVIRSFNMQFGTTESLGGTLASAPAAASWGPMREDVFARAVDNTLSHISWNGSTWSAFGSLGGSLTSAPGAVSWGPNRIDVFARSTDNALWHTWWDGANWIAWESLGGVLTSGPDVASWAPTRLDVFVRGTDNALWHKWYDGISWNGWESLGGVLASDPAAVSWSKNRIDVFVRGTDNALWHKWYDGIRWNGWESLGGGLTSGPAVSSCGGASLNVFALGTAGALFRKAYNPNGWNAWESLGGSWASDPAAVCRPGTMAVDVFIRGTDNALWHEGLRSA